MPHRPGRVPWLKDWKQGGYRDWLAQQEARDWAQRVGQDATQPSLEGHPPLTETLALWLASRYAVTAFQITHHEAAKPWSLLREFCADLAKLRRGDLAAERLRLQHEKLDFQRQRLRDETKFHQPPSFHAPGLTRQPPTPRTLPFKVIQP